MKAKNPMSYRIGFFIPVIIKIGSGYIPENKVLILIL